MTVKVNITDNYGKEKVSNEIRALARKACRATLREENFCGDAEIELTFVDDSKIKEINKEYRDIDNSTDVLSFPLGENGIYDKNPENGFFMLGDIVISVDHAKTQADLYGHGINREIAFLTVHSMLHLLGFDHINGGKEERIMRQKEETVLEKMGLSVER